MNQDKCQYAINQLQSKLEEEKITYQDMAKLCQEFPDCKDKLHTYYTWWEELEALEVPEPSEGLRRNFQLLLNEAKHEAVSKKAKVKIKKVWPLKLASWSALAATFVLGILLGGLLLSRQADFLNLEKRAEVINSPIPEKALFTSNSAMDRLQALQNTKERQELDEEIIEILNQLLLKDENINVRLSALEAMIFFADHPQVKENLIRAIPHQTSPILQLTLAEAALALDNEAAIAKIQELLQQKQLELEVKMKLEDSINILL